MGGFNGYAGACALAFIMIPIVARTTEEMLRLVPNSYRDASIALGATKNRTILHVVLPAASGSIITGVMLAIARVAGETAPLLFTALGSRLLTLDPSHPFPVADRAGVCVCDGSVPGRTESGVGRHVDFDWIGICVEFGVAAYGVPFAAKSADACVGCVDRGADSRSNRFRLPRINCGAWRYRKWCSHDSRRF